MLTLVIVRNGLNVYDGAQENTEDGGDLNLITTTIRIAVTVYCLQEASTVSNS